MSNTYGVLPEGFVPKNIATILDELEQAMVATFGPGIIQTSQSPLGQINGVMTDALVDAQETLADVYASFDADQAEGPRLDIVAKLRGLARPDDETDDAFRLRITNFGQADISFTANLNRLRDLPSVTFAAVRANSGETTDALGLPPHSVAYAVTGGTDEAVALAVFQNSVGGITLFGNVSIPVIADGFCQQVAFIRPAEVPIRVEVDVRPIADSRDSAPPSVGTIAAAVVAAFSGEAGYRNGDTVLETRIASEAAQVGDIEVVETRIARNADLIVVDQIPTAIFERPVILAPYVSVRYV
ncbi:hypothetical protein [Antarcticirhabdus aurantiaca]|uniref:Uncharacterized protein n=1 Tax=Antarcticirhabdus aurantiaca TaxID=2606717 RepID=A0ACD4NJW0_9HYPH|nr:hypothetical protein [Antarcticirhabdus aurantiaca]WAJ27145.1 hypothetical protein OXU80_20145 [Jeongeuplla avenae]